MQPVCVYATRTAVASAPAALTDIHPQGMCNLLQRAEAIDKQGTVSVLCSTTKQHSTGQEALLPFLSNSGSRQLQVSSANGPCARPPSYLSHVGIAARGCEGCRDNGCEETWGWGRKEVAFKIHKARQWGLLLVLRLTGFIANKHCCF